MSDLLLLCEHRSICHKKIRRFQNFALLFLQIQPSKCCYQLARKQLIVRFIVHIMPTIYCPVNLQGLPVGFTQCNWSPALIPHNVPPQHKPRRSYFKKGAFGGRAEAKPRQKPATSLTWRVLSLGLHGVATDKISAATRPSDSPPRALSFTVLLLGLVRSGFILSVLWYNKENERSPTEGEA